MPDIEILPNFVGGDKGQKKAKAPRKPSVTKVNIHKKAKSMGVGVGAGTQNTQFPTPGPSNEPGMGYGFGQAGGPPVGLRQYRSTERSSYDASTKQIYLWSRPPFTKLSSSLQLLQLPSRDAVTLKTAISSLYLFVSPTDHSKMCIRHLKHFRGCGCNFLVSSTICELDAIGKCDHVSHTFLYVDGPCDIPGCPSQPSPKPKPATPKPKL
ncbi:hypothetical protein OQA88_5770 [Cercophora sp. LCS_1]